MACSLVQSITVFLVYLVFFLALGNGRPINDFTSSVASRPTTNFPPVTTTVPATDGQRIPHMTNYVIFGTFGVFIIFGILGWIAAKIKYFIYGPLPPSPQQQKTCYCPECMAEREGTGTNTVPEPEEKSDKTKKYRRQGRIPDYFTDFWPTLIEYAPKLGYDPWELNGREMQATVYLLSKFPFMFVDVDYNEIENIAYLNLLPFPEVGADWSSEVLTESDMIRKYYAFLLPFSSVSWKSVQKESCALIRLLTTQLPFGDVSAEELRECVCSDPPKRKGEKRRRNAAVIDIEAAIWNAKAPYWPTVGIDMLHYEDELTGEQRTAPISSTCLAKRLRRD